MENIIIEVSGGCVTNVLSTTSDVMVIIVDHDNIKNECTIEQQREIGDTLDSKFFHGGYTNISFGHGTTLEQVRNL